MKPITKLLVANRGEIACRIMRTARAMGIATVAVYSEPDADAAHVRAADEAVALGGSTAAESYLVVDKLLEAARRTGADAVHPGYGFLAENAAFARACADAGLVFVGPSPDVIAAMGDKLRAKELLAAAGVPVLRSVTVTGDEIPALDGVPFPVLVKASAGGGGKGMRIVASAAELADAVAAARREAAAAFGDDTVFIEPYVERPRHIEVQILGDSHGTVLHVGERECSIQRRYQKVVEEAPSPAVDDALRERLTAAAVAAGRELGYTNAGTVEFIATQDGQFFFLEVNTRLQVEHPVSELVWRVDDQEHAPLDLVRLQLLVAMGDSIPFAQDDLELVGHAIEARLYAEDPAAGFLPATGKLSVWDPPEIPGVRFDSGVHEGCTVGVHYDPLLAKVIAHAPTRTEAALLLARALAETRVHGLVTNRDFLVRTLRHPAFLAGELHTGFIDEHGLAAHAPAGDETLLVHSAAAALAAVHIRRAEAALPILRTVPPGWRNNPSQPQFVEFAVPGTDEPLRVGYARRRDGAWTVEAAGREATVRVAGWPETGDTLDLEVDGVRRPVRARWDDEVAAVDSPLGSTTLRRLPRFPVAETEEAPGSLLAPMPGNVLQVLAEPGQAVSKGDLLLILEAMKMEHRITAPHDGVVADVRVAAGQQIDAGMVLAVIEQPEG
jgi:propionyl-CoA carboxylase alpha chain